MKKNPKKCTSKDHENFDANIYCKECHIYMCTKCEKIHSGLCINHNTFKLDKDINEIFTGFCKIENHRNKIEYYCKDHNELCCGLCITKIEGKGNGQHKNCNICFLEDIKDEKKNKLNENIKYLEDLSKTIEQSITKLKEIFEEINKNKEALKIEIQNIFTQIRNEINEREDKLLSEVDKEFKDIFFKEDLIKTAEKLPKNLKKFLENGKNMNTEWNDNNKLSLLINDSIIIENNINDINKINENVQKNNEIHNRIIFNTKKNNINNLENIINIIKNFGIIDIEGEKKEKKEKEEKKEGVKNEEKPVYEFEDDDIDLGGLF